MDKKDATLGKWTPGWEGPWNILRVLFNNAYEIEELNDDNRIMRKNGKGNGSITWQLSIFFASIFLRAESFED
ncbi:hypothetical protein MTR_0217s0080 [Medicago truncatula]|uniref:Uncharacterized protein n=1 Tax=Medicago truncatula TaxID=3880 RepID=A0A072TGA3_MEDTR|nr:hypothetical protein MTR_0217s0080 [Medicago truncatula]